MGRVPIMNRDTISKKATEALTTMAAKNEKDNKTSIPSEDTVAAIDDTLSMVTGMEFFGKKTKTYTNPRDKDNSGAFCTIPVKYTFPDKDTRIEAETVLREKCGIQCSTPYPIIVRKCIKQVIDKVKQDYPGDQVKVTVDAHHFGLRVSRRQKKAGESSKDNRWEQFNFNIPLPELALKVNLRKVPENFQLDLLPPGRDKGMAGSPVKTLIRDTEMESSNEGSSG
jgi:hypothetical protein